MNRKPDISVQKGLTEREIFGALRAKASKICPAKEKKRKRKKKLRPGRLDAAGMKALREERYAMDGGRCVVCHRRRPLTGGVFSRMHLAHIVSRGAGGGDTIENTRCLCFDCHIVEEHCGGKVVPSKRGDMRGRA